MFKTHASRGFLICLCVTLIVLALDLSGLLRPLELKSVDFRFQQRGTRPVNKDIVVVAIDEASIGELGRFPWPRSTHGELVQKLSKFGAKVIAFDVLFTEPDKSHPASDQAFARAVKESDRVVSAFFFSKGMEHHLIGHEPLFPYPALLEDSYLGFVNFNPDQDGVSRRGHLYAVLDNEVYPSLSVATLARLQDKSIEDLLPTLPVQVSADPYQARNELFINYADAMADDGYPMYSYADVLSGKISADAFKNKIVLVGGTAAALFDVKATPFQPIFYGVLIHANIIDNLLVGNYMRQSSLLVAPLYVLVLGLLLGVVLPKLNPWAKIIGFVVIIGGGAMLAQWFFNSSNLIVPMVAPLLTGIGCYGGTLFYRLVVEEREKRKIKGSFRQYLSPKIIDIITKDPSKLQLGGEDREVSIFFLDIAGFTTMSETLKPTQLVEVMNSCLNEFSKVIHKHDGLINKYIGDCIMAFWNAPVDQPRHATQACLAALECISILPDINRRFAEKGLPSIDCRVGINTGTVVVGNMGSDDKFDYTVLGDAVNLASRMEGANKQYHTRIMVSDSTFDRAREDIEARDLDLIRVKGKKEPRKVFEVLCKKGEMSNELSEGRKRFHQGLSLYRQRCFDDAVHAFQSVFDYLPNDRVTRVYLERARAFVTHPPPATWDGVYDLLTK